MARARLWGSARGSLDRPAPATDIFPGLMIDTRAIS
jgi:hypothetical protein